jgi:hypothetical protein
MWLPASRYDSLSRPATWSRFENADRRTFDARVGHRMEAVAGGHIDRDLQLVLEIMLDADEIEGVEPASR